ncbi:shikimate dehydrogenase [Corynebacterium sp. S7]
MSYLIGLIGSDIQLSRTPRMHEEEGQAQGLRLVYKPIDTAHVTTPFPELFEAVQQVGFDGTNVTHPFKQEVMGYLDEIDEQARNLGAVNTVVFREGKSYGYNTDFSGYSRALRSLDDPDLSHVVQLGAGGAGSAVAWALHDAGVEDLIIVDPDEEKARHLAEQVGARVGLYDDIATATGVVNTTPCGMPAHPEPAFDTSLLTPDMWVSDVVYMPVETELLRRAKAIGCMTLDGSRMAVGQAVDAFELFTGREANEARMAATFASFDA